MITCYDLSDGQEPVSFAELDYLHTLAELLPAEPTIVNIGAADGLSTIAFLEAKPNANIFSVDVEPCQQEFANVRNAGLDVHRVTRMLGRSQEIGPVWPGQCDLLFIDGDHWDAAGDIEAWVKTGKVKSGGIIAFHDYQEVCAPNNPGSVFEHVNAGMEGYELIGRVDRVIAFWMP